MKLIHIVDEYTEPDDKIVLVNAGSPVGFYFAHRKVWWQSDEDPLSWEKLEEVTTKGARILIINRRNPKASYELPVLYEDSNYRVYRLATDE